MPRKRKKSASGTYDVGYCRPPKRTQFKRGRAANPSGINKKTVRSMAPNFRARLEDELKKPIKIQKGKQKLTVTQEAAGIGELVRQFAKGDHRALRDLILLCDKLEIDLTNREALQGALEDALSAEDEAILADFVKRHGGQYPLSADVSLASSTKDAKLLTSGSAPSFEKVIESQNPKKKEVS
jgi:Family of unknown function (DUF5681)